MPSDGAPNRRSGDDFSLAEASAPVRRRPVTTLICAFSSLDLPSAARSPAEGRRALLRCQARATARLVALGVVYRALVASFAGPLLGLWFDGRYGDVTTLCCC